jgi:hypothetical protein
MTQDDKLNLIIWALVVMLPSIIGINFGVWHLVRILERAR